LGKYYDLEILYYNSIMLKAYNAHAEQEGIPHTKSNVFLFTVTLQLSQERFNHFGQYTNNW